MPLHEQLRRYMLPGMLVIVSIGMLAPTGMAASLPPSGTFTDDAAVFVRNISICVRNAEPDSTRMQISTDSSPYSTPLNDPGAFTPGTMAPSPDTLTPDTNL